jgi:hypothetical protein
MHPADDDIFSSQASSTWHDERHAELCLGHDGDSAEAVLCSGQYLYRPRQVLVEAIEPDALADATGELTQRGGVPHAEANDQFGHAGLPVRSFLMPPEVHIPELVTELRQREGGRPRLNVSPNHVFSGEPEYHGGPAGEPRSAKPFSEAVFSSSGSGAQTSGGAQAGSGALSGSGAQAPTIAVLDTGYDQAVQTLHPGLAGRLVFEDSDIEDAVLPSGYLAREGGHGTFIDGIIMRMAPQARIRQVKVLTPAGVGDDQSIALALVQAARDGIPVINLSLGGYTSHDEPPLATALTLAHLVDDVAIVAAAGNSGKERPFWPAAFKRVVSVGALDTRAGEIRRASFSNHGWWVDVYAPGVRILSTHLQATWKLPNDKSPRTIDGFAYWSGTSFAAPQVAAMIANAIPAAGSARQAVLQVLAQARWVPELGPVLIPDATLAGSATVPSS